MDLIERARDTLQSHANAALATVSPDGRPWNSPVYVAFDGDLTFYWSSHNDAEHSKNIAANANVLLVVFDSAEPDKSGRAAYIRARARELSKETDIQRAVERLAKRKRQTPRPPTDFMGEHRRRMYEAAPDMVWANVVKEEGGHYFDERVPIDVQRISQGLPSVHLNGRRDDSSYE